MKRIKKNKPSYDLAEIKALLQMPGTRIITRQSRKDAVKLGYADDEDMANRVCLLTAGEFYKTMESELMPDLCQDVYRTHDGPVGLYIKVQISWNGKGVIISFKEA